MNQLGFLHFTLLYVAGFHLKNGSLTHVSFSRQLQTSWLDMFKQFVWVVVCVILFCQSYKFYLSIIIVGRGFTSKLLYIICAFFSALKCSTLMLHFSHLNAQSPPKKSLKCLDDAHYTKGFF